MKIYITNVAPETIKNKLNKFEMFLVHKREKYELFSEEFGLHIIENVDSEKQPQKIYKVETNFDTNYLLELKLLEDNETMKKNVDELFENMKFCPNIQFNLETKIFRTGIFKLPVKMNRIYHSDYKATSLDRKGKIIKAGTIEPIDLELLERRNPHAKIIGDKILNRLEMLLLKPTPTINESDPEKAIILGRQQLYSNEDDRTYFSNVMSLKSFIVPDPDSYEPIIENITLEHIANDISEKNPNIICTLIVITCRNQSINIENPSVGIPLNSYLKPIVENIDSRKKEKINNEDLVESFTNPYTPSEVLKLPIVLDSNGNKSGLFFSIEMTKKNLYKRFISLKAKKFEKLCSQKERDEAGIQLKLTNLSVYDSQDDLNCANIDFIRMTSILESKKFAGYQKFIAYVDEHHDHHLFDVAKPKGKYLVLIGPEGDFDPSEIQKALANGFQPVSLGRSRLRTETAGLAAVEMLQLINR